MTSHKHAWLNKVVAAGALMACIGAASAEPIRIGIANFGEHPQLNASIVGFKKALTAGGYVEGKDVVYTTSHTNFDATLVPQMLAKLQSEKPKLIFALTTPVAQIAKKAIAGAGIPVVFAAVTDPVAAKLTPSWEKGDKNITGASDLQDVAAIMAFSRKLVPTAKTFGMPYNPGEANDVAVLDKLKAAAPAAGFTIAAVGVDSVNDIQQRITSLKGKADVLYNPTSNLLQPAVGAVASAARQAGIPVVNADEDAVRKGIVPASFAVGYEQVGYSAGKIALQILKGASAESIAPTRPTFEDHTAVVSRKALKAFGMQLPVGLANCNCLVD